jgi:hypothetical protein
VGFILSAEITRIYVLNKSAACRALLLKKELDNFKFLEANYISVYMTIERLI